MPVRKLRISQLIDIGKRAGVTAGLLGVLCVFAEACFLFPDLLVSHDARGFYHEHIGVFRAILQVTIYAYVIFVSFHAVYIHANVNHRWPYVRRVIATPAFHHWHHTSDEEGIDKNFAVFLSFIDAMFGTAYMPDHWPKQYGTVKFQPPETYLGQLAYPFRRTSTPYG